MKRWLLFSYLLTFSSLTSKIEAQEVICSENKNVTREAYCIFLNENDAQDCYEASSEILHVGILGHDHYEVIGEKNSSMNFISWDDAQAYCDWKNNISSAEEFAVTFYVDGSDAGSIDHSLRSNLFTFSVVQNASQMAGLEEIGVDETILSDIAEIFLGLVILEVATEHVSPEEAISQHESLNRTSTLEDPQTENSIAESDATDRQKGFISWRQLNATDRTDSMNTDLRTRDFGGEGKMPVLPEVPVSIDSGKNIISNRSVKQCSPGDRKGISFDDKMIYDPSKQSSLKSHTIKISETESAESGLFLKKYKTEFRKLYEAIDEKIIALAEETPAAVAAIYAAAYPEVKAKLEEFIMALKENSNLQNKKTAKLLSSKTIEFLKMLPKMCDFTTMEPVALEQTLEYLRDLPTQHVYTSSGEVASINNRKRGVALLSADRLISSCKAFSGVFKKENLDEMQEEFRYAKEDYVDSNYHIAYEKYKIFSDLSDQSHDLFLKNTTEENKNADLEAIGKLQKSYESLEIAHQEIKLIKDTPLPSDQKKLCELAISQLMEHAQEASDIAEEFQKMFTSQTINSPGL